MNAKIGDNVQVFDYFIKDLLNYGGWWIQFFLYGILDAVMVTQIFNLPVDPTDTLGMNAAVITDKILLALSLVIFGLTALLNPLITAAGWSDIGRSDMSILSMITQIGTAAIGLAPSFILLKTYEAAI